MAPNRQAGPQQEGLLCVMQVYNKLITLRELTGATAPVGLDSRPLEQCKPALDCQLAAVGGLEALGWSGTEEQSTLQIVH